MFAFPSEPLRASSRKSCTAGLAGWASCCARSHHPSHLAGVLIGVAALPSHSLAQTSLALALNFCRYRCRAHLGPCGDHLAARPRSGILRARGCPLERAAARVRKEAGAAVTLNVNVKDLNVDPARQDDRRIEVIASGLPLWGGGQLAVDTTLVSPLAAAAAAAGGWRPYCRSYLAHCKTLQDEPKSAHTRNCARPTAAGSQSLLLRLGGL